MTVLAARNAAATALPLQDDRAEKHKRRRESAVALMKSADRRRSVLRPQTGAGAGGAMHAVDVGAPLPGADAMPPVVIAENYEQWMKIAADNVGLLSWRLVSLDSL